MKKTVLSPCVKVFLTTLQSVNMKNIVIFNAISRVFPSYLQRICSFQQCEYCGIRNVSMGFSKSLFGMCDLENSILTFPTHSILSLLTNKLLSKTIVRQW